MSLYSLKSSGTIFRAFIAEQMDEMGFNSCIADPDVWIMPATKLYVEQYYEFIFLYIDDLLAIIKDAVSVIRKVAEKLEYKKIRLIRLRFTFEDNRQGWNGMAIKYGKLSASTT